MKLTTALAAAVLAATVALAIPVQPNEAMNEFYARSGLEVSDAVLQLNQRSTDFDALQQGDHVFAARGTGDSQGNSILQRRFEWSKLFPFSLFKSAKYEPGYFEIVKLDETGRPFVQHKYNMKDERYPRYLDEKEAKSYLNEHNKEKARKQRDYARRMRRYVPQDQKKRQASDQELRRKLRWLGLG